MAESDMISYSILLLFRTDRTTCRGFFAVIRGLIHISFLKTRSYLDHIMQYVTFTQWIIIAVRTIQNTCLVSIASASLITSLPWND